MLHDFNDREDGLLHCKLCNGAEGSLPQDCPGTRMSADTADAVYHGHIDYRQDRWVPLPDPR